MNAIAFVFFVLNCFIQILCNRVDNELLDKVFDDDGSRRDELNQKHVEGAITFLVLEFNRRQ